MNDSVLTLAQLIGFFGVLWVATKLGRAGAWAWVNIRRARRWRGKIVQLRDGRRVRVLGPFSMAHPETWQGEGGGGKVIEFEWADTVGTHGIERAASEESPNLQPNPNQDQASGWEQRQKMWRNN